MNSQSLTSLSALTLGQMIRDLEVSPVEVINNFLERIHSYRKLRIILSGDLIPGKSSSGNNNFAVSKLS